MLERIPSLNKELITRPKWAFLAFLIGFVCSMLIVGILPIPTVDYTTMGIPVEIVNIYRMSSLLLAVSWSCMLLVVGYIQGVNRFGVRLVKEQIEE